ncbi:MAG: hypothetical protein ABEI99_03890, partial [Halobaculum sp.]
MRLNRRVSLAVLSGIGLTLTGVLLFDVYEDWVVQGNTLGSTVVENALPFVFLLGVFYAVWTLRRGEYDEAFVSSVTTWTVAGTLVAALLVGWVVGIQLLQNELKPWIIVLQTTVVGAGAGLIAGYNTAAVERARDRSKRRKERFEALFENDPAAIADLQLDGDQFVFEAANPEFETQFGTDDSTLPGIDAETAAAFRESDRGRGTTHPRDDSRHRRGPEALRGRTG